MTNKKSSHPPPNGNDKTAKLASPGEPDDTGQFLLDEMKRSYSDPQFPAVTDEEEAAFVERKKLDDAKERHDTIPPWESDKIRRAQIQAWNHMADKMVDVVRTIKKNEFTLNSIVRRIFQLVIATATIVLGGSGVDWYLGDTVIDHTAEQMSVMQQRLDSAATKQDAMLHAVIELAEAQALRIEADMAFDPSKDTKARLAALDALQAALEAKKKTTADDSSKAAVDEQIRQLDKQREMIDDGPP